MKYFLVLLSVITITSCTLSKRQITSQNYHVEFYKADFEYSPQVIGSATVVRVLGIDWKRIFNRAEGNIGNEFPASNSAASGSVNLVGGSPETTVYASANYILNSLPIVGTAISNKDEAYAVHDLLLKNGGYDVLIFPQFESSRKGVPFIYTKNQVKVTARLARIKN